MFKWNSRRFSALRFIRFRIFTNSNRKNPHNSSFFSPISIRTSDEIFALYKVLSVPAMTNTCSLSHMHTHTHTNALSLGSRFQFRWLRQFGSIHSLYVPQPRFATMRRLFWCAHVKWRNYSSLAPSLSTRNTFLSSSSFLPFYLHPQMMIVDSCCIPSSVRWLAMSHTFKSHSV